MRRCERGARAPAAALLGLAAALFLAGLALGAPSRQGAGEWSAMIRRVLTAPEASARVTLERSDPFGGPPDRERGRVWYLPGRGLRYRADKTTGDEVALDRVQDRMLLFRRSEPRVYRSVWAKAPLRLRRLVAEPERVLAGASAAGRESRSIHGASRPGWRLKPATLGTSAEKVAVWVSDADKTSGLPRFIAVAGDVDTLVIEFREWSLARKANPRDLDVRVPRGTPESPLDPRDLLQRGGAGGESR